jgi:hypothetical protein
VVDDKGLPPVAELYQRILVPCDGNDADNKATVALPQNDWLGTVTVAGPGMGLILNACIFVGLFPALLTAITEMLPPVEPTVTVIETPILDELIAHPEGTDHEYDVAPLTAVI